ncbi:MAG: hypothetical protein WCX31_04080 [Salinivirgaceae bacterium]|jgi:hypothetical protein
MEIKGTAVKSINDFVINNYNSGYIEWFNSLSAPAKNIVKNTLSNQWYPLQEAVVEPTQKIANLFYGGDIKKAAFECGQYSAQVALNGVYKLYVKFSSPEHVVDRGSRILPAYYNPSKIIQIGREKQMVRYEMTECIGIDEVVEYRIAGWMQKALEISGCKTYSVIITESVKTNGRTVFEARWT